MDGLSQDIVPNPIANLPPSPARHVNPDDCHDVHNGSSRPPSRQHSLSLSPLLDVDIELPLDSPTAMTSAESDSKRFKPTDVSIRWSEHPIDHHDAASSMYEPVNFSPHQQLLSSKPSSSSLASSHPSHNSFASTDSNANTSTPDSATFATTAGGTTVHSGYAIHSRPHHVPASEFSPSARGRRLKRLERNRESARLSRKRRKAYLEELEVKVHEMSAVMDSERVAYSLGFLDLVKGRYEKSSNISERGDEGVHSGIKHNLHPNHTNTIATKTRIPSALQIIYTFQHAYLSSLVITREHKFIQWLYLQKEQFWRGGRGSSERLSAARIGERLLNNGTYRATPSGGMWPLFCNEVGLSYEQEDKVRQTQRALLADKETWIHRHTAAATKNVLDSIQTTISGMHEAAKRREQSVLDILTPEQRDKFLAWASQKSSAIHKLAQTKLDQINNDVNEYETSPERHVAANMYIIDHRLSKIKSRIIPAPAYVHPSRLKKLSRRPSFESLAGQDALENNSKPNNKLNRNNSFPSTGSLKRTLNDLTGEENIAPTNTMNAHGSITVESAHAAAQPAVRAVLQDIMPIVPQAYQRQMNVAHFRPCTPNSASNQAVFASSSHVNTAQEPLYAKSRVASTIPQAQPQYPVAPPPPVSSDDIDIPMPTPVSVLLQTQDEFLDVDSSATPIEVTSSLQPPPQPTVESFIPSIHYDPDPIHSQHNPPLSTRAYASAPQLYTGNEFDYPSLMPAASSMMPVLEESFIKNKSDDEIDLEDFPLSDPNDWAIGESFDMEVDGKK